VITLLLACAAQAQNSTTRGKAADGYKLFVAHGCYGCHGFNGETGARDLVATRSPIIATEAAFKSFLRMRADQAPVLPSARMPNYPVSALSDAQVDDLFAYVSALRQNAPTVESVPTLRAILKSAAKPYTP
jgi:cytochrome c553